MKITVEQQFTGNHTLPLKITIEELDLKNKDQIETIKNLLNELVTNWVTDLKPDETLRDEKL